MKKNKFNIKNGFSVSVFFLLVFLIITVRLLTPSWYHHDWLAIISWDVFGYYLYLPAWFIHHDLGIKDFGWVQQILDTYHPTIGFYQAYLGPAGHYVMKYPMGLAILYSPFFIAGHVAAHLFGYSPDGFTLPYQISIAFGGVIYTLIGLWFLRKILLHYFSDLVAAVTMVIIVLGTNYFELTAIDGAMPHNYLFTAFALIVWLTIKWHENPQWRYAVPLGLLCGLVILIRPTSGIIILVPILWGLWGKNAVKQKFSQILGNYLQVISMAIALCAVVFIQMAYWKIHTGSFFYFSYGKDDSLKWIAPYLWEVLFSYRKGWLLYTPIMVFAWMGFVPLAVKYRSVFLSVFLFSAVNLLIVASWPAWWYAGSFSQRALMESYLLFAFSLGAFIDWVFLRKNYFKWGILLVLCLLIGFNLFQTWQYGQNIIHPSKMTKIYYWKVFGKTSVSLADSIYLVPSDNIEERETLSDSTMYHSRVIISYDFETPGQVSPENLCPDKAHTGKYSLRMSKKMEFSPGINLPYKDLSKKDFAWIRASAWVYFTSNREEAACGLVVTCNRDSTVYKYRILNLEKQNLSPGVWNKVTMDYLTPFLENKNKPVQAYFWFRGSKELYIDDVEIRVFELNE